LVICEQFIALNPHDLDMYLLACSICVNFLEESLKCMSFSQKAIEILAEQNLNFIINSQNQKSIWIGKFHLCRGTAASKLALKENIYEKRLAYQKIALSSLHKAVTHLRNSPDAFHTLAMQYADINEIDAAILFEEKALLLDPYRSVFWNALALMFSAKQWIIPSFHVIEAGLLHQSNDLRFAYILFSLFSTKEKLFLINMFTVCY
jgi:tetratricopeptide (TPR) repeat protein